MNVPPPIRFIDAFRFWLKLGFMSFGGPAGQISLMHTELVERRRWISERRFLHALNYCMLLPGPEAQQLATYMGWLMHRSWGGIVAGSLFILPSLCILIGLSWIYLAFGETALVSGLFYGIKPAVTAIVIHATYRIGSRTLHNPAQWAIALSAFVALFILKIPFPAIVATAATIGLIGGKFFPHLFTIAPSTHHPLTHNSTPIDEPPTSAASHTRFRWRRLISIITMSSLLWLIPMLILITVFGWQATLTQMAWFFTKAALVTFGGAYAVLPYVYQAAVHQYGWLTGSQMIDGLALGETTPGPLIMVVAFVGFVGGYTQVLLGTEHPFLAGALAATVVTYFSFLPSFLFILAGAPLVEATHDNIRFTAPLTAITAAIVGVIMNLALFFAYHTMWPRGFNGPFEWPSALLALGATVALLSFKRSVTEVIILCAIIGLATRFATG